MSQFSHLQKKLLAEQVEEEKTEAQYTKRRQAVRFHLIMKSRERKPKSL